MDNDESKGSNGVFIERKYVYKLRDFVEVLSRTPQMPDTLWPIIFENLDLLSRIIRDDLELEKKNVKAITSKKGTDKRYARQRELLNQLEGVARDLWEGGSTLLHHQMKDYLLNDYADANDNLPFVSLAEKTVLSRVKQIAKEMNRYDLISGLEKP